MGGKDFTPISRHNIPFLGVILMDIRYQLVLEKHLTLSIMLLITYLVVIDLFK